MIDEATVVGSKFRMESAIRINVYFFSLFVPEKVLSRLYIIAI